MSNENIANVGKRLFKYLEIKNWEDAGVVRRIDVSEKTDRQIGKLKNGMDINLNHKQFYTVSYDSEVELDTI